MFQLQSITARLKNVNTRPEKHGPENVTAMDLKFLVKLSNTRLGDFNPKLRAALYMEDLDAPQDELELGERNSLTKLAFPKMGALPWGQESEGYQLTIEYGINEGSWINLDTCKFNKVKFKPQEGGTVEIEFRIQFYPNGAEQIGIINMMADKDINIHLIAPAAETPADLFPE